MNNNEVNKAMRNPMEFTYKVTNQTFALENHFSVAKIENGEFPLAIYDERFSRLTGVVISDGVNATFNIRKNDIPAIIAKSIYAFNKSMDVLINTSDEVSSSDNATNSIAYTVKFTSGKLKGKSPAEVLLEDPNNKELLNSQYSFLKKNASKFPKNKEQMDAIVEASRLLNDGKLSKENVKKAVIVPIYAPGFRPLRSRTRDDGKSFIYDIKINWYIGTNNPVVIEVSNFYAPVVQTEAGLLNVKAKEKDSENKCKISLSPEAWMDVIYDIKAQMRAFEICNYSNAYSAAIAQEKQNKNNSSQR